MKVYPLIFVVFLCNQVILAQDILSVNFSRLGEEHGLPGGVALDITQDAQNYYWIANNLGVFRFDGNHFTPIDRIYTFEKYEPVGVNKIHITKHQALWFCNRQGIYYVNLKSGITQSFLFKNVRELNTIPNDPVIKIIEQKNNQLLFITSSGVLLSHPFHKPIKTAFKQEHAHPDKKPLRVFDALIYNKNLWLATNNGLFKCHIKEQHALIEKHFLPKGHLRGISIVNDKMYFAKGWKENYFLDLKTEQFKPIKVPAFMHSRIMANCIKHTEDGVFYLGTFNEIIEWNANKNTWTYLDEHIKNKIGPIIVFDIFLDNLNQYWFLTDNGLYKKEISTNNIQNHLYIKQREKIKYSTRNILEIYPNKLLIGNYKTGSQLLDLQSKAHTKFKVKVLQTNKEDIHKSVLYNSIKDSLQNTWFSLETFGLFRLGNIDLANENLILENHSFKNDYPIEPRSFLLLPNHKILIGGRNKLSLFDIKTNFISKVSLPKRLLPENGINKLLAQDSYIWMACSPGLIAFKLQNDSLVEDVKIHFKFTNVYDITVNEKHELLLATNRGLIKYNTNTQISSIINKEDGLLGNTIYTITRDPFNKNKHWLATNNGLNLYNDSTNEVLFINETKGIEFNSFSSCVTEDKKIILGTTNGVIQFDPSAVQLEKIKGKFRVTYWSRLNENNEKEEHYHISDTVNISISESNKYLSIHYAFSNYSESCTPNYQYKLAGYDNNWTSTGNTGNCKFTSLPKGDYELQLRTQQCNGSWMQAQQPIFISVFIPWYKSSWFFIAVGITIFLIGYLLISWYYRSKLKVQKLRTEIASNLHDDIGGLLTSISVNSSLEGELAEQKETKLAFQKISKLSSEITAKISDVVWTVDARNDNLQSLLNKFQEITMSLFSSKKINYITDIRVPIEDVKISLKQRQELYYIGKEAMNNTAKHSNADKFTLSIKPRNKGLIAFCFSDNGNQGISENRLTGIGLKNMEMRAKKIGTTFKLDTEFGFSITIEIKT